MKTKNKPQQRRQAFAENTDDLNRIDRTLSATYLLEDKSRNNRIYVDNLVRQISIEIRLPLCHRDKTWYDVELPSYCSRMNNAEKEKIVISGKSAIVFRTGKQLLSRREIAIITDFIVSTPVCYTLKEAREAMSVLFNDCQLEALNIINHANTTNF